MDASQTASVFLSGSRVVGVGSGTRPYVAHGDTNPRQLQEEK